MLGGDRTQLGNMNSLTTIPVVNSNNMLSMLDSGKKGVSNVMNSNSKMNSEDVETLYKTLEQQYALIGEMDTENARLSQENKSLQEKVKGGK